MKVLISAYACSPFQGSEPGVGWGFVRELSRFHDLHVIVDREFQAAIEHFLKLNPNDPVCSVRFHFIERKRTWVAERLWPPAYYWTYRRWQQQAFELAKALHRRERFDVVHQLTMIGFREPGYLWKLDAPFVWGPVGGMGLFPWSFLTQEGIYGALYFLGYNIFNLIQMRISPRAHRAARAAGDGFIAINKENQQGARRFFSLDSDVCIPVGPPAQAVSRPKRRNQNEPFRIVWAGLLIPRKSPSLALRAVARLPSEIDWELIILGDGPLSRKMRGLAHSLGIATRCKFYGNVERDVVLKTMMDSHVHLLTSLREGTPSVVVEAAACGAPTVCLALSGMVDMVDERSGLLVESSSPKRSMTRLVNALTTLARDEAYRFSLAEGALRAVEELSWKVKAAHISAIYQRKSAGR